MTVDAVINLVTNVGQLWYICPMFVDRPTLKYEDQNNKQPFGIFPQSLKFCQTNNGTMQGVDYLQKTYGIIHLHFSI